MSRILIVDDEIMNLSFLEEALINMGHTIEDKAQSGEQALEKALTGNPELIIMDIRMPGKYNGIEAATLINKNRHIPIIFLTAFGDDEYQEQIKSTEVYAYLIKPVHLKELQFMISVALLRRELEIQLSDALDKSKKETAQKSILYQLLSQMNQRLDPLETIHGALEKARDYFQSAGVGLYRLENNNILRLSDIVSASECPVKSITSELNGNNLKIGLEKHFYEDGINIPPDIIRNFSDPVPAKLILRILSSGEEIYGYLAVFSYDQSYRFGNECHQFLTMIGEIISAVFHRHNDLLLIEEQKQEAIKNKEFIARAERLASLGKLTSAIGHEIYQPLQSIKVLSESMLYWNQKNNKIPMEEVMDNLGKISERVKRVESIIQCMKSIMNTPERMDLENLELNDIVMEVIENYRKDGGLNELIIESDLPAHSPTALVSRIPLQQVLTNLINNAVHALDDNTVKNKIIRVSVGQNNDAALITVEDNGPGINEAYLDRIFDPFFSTGKHKGGMGIGLYLVHNIIKAFDGTIEAVNKPGGGALFRISLGTEKTMR